MPNCSSREPTSPRARPLRRVSSPSLSDSRPSRLFFWSMQLYQTLRVFASTVGAYQSGVGAGGVREREKHLFESLRTGSTDREASCLLRGRLSSEGKAMWPFYFLFFFVFLTNKKYVFAWELKGAEQGSVWNTCMLHVQNTWTMSFFFNDYYYFYCTVTCILETHSHGRLLCLFIGPFKWTVVKKLYAFVVFLSFSICFCIWKYVNAVGEMTLRDNGHSAVRRLKTLVWMVDCWSAGERETVNALSRLHGERRQRMFMGRGTLDKFVNTNVKKKKKIAEAHSVFLLFDMETCMIFLS